MDRKAWDVVDLKAPHCVEGPFDDRTLSRLLEIELLAERLRIAKDAGEASRPAFTVEIRGLTCSDEMRQVSIGLRSATGHEAERAVMLGDVPVNARPRALAIAVAELVRETRWRETTADASKPVSDEGAHKLDEQAETKAAGQGAAVPASQLAASDVRPAPFEAQASARWRFFTASKTSLFGGSLAGSVPLRPTHLRLRFDAAAQWTTIADPIGRVDLALYSGGVAALFTTPNLPAFVLGPRVELGFGRADGVPERANVGHRPDSRFVALLSVLAGAHAKLYATWTAVLEVEAGVTLSGLEARADDRTVGSMRGAFGTASVGIAVAP